MNRTAAACFSILVSLALCSCSRPALGKSDAFAPARPMGVVKSDSICEVSGIAASRLNPGVLWLHNDSGEAARIFALDTRAELLGTCTIAGARARDWEDIAVGPGPDPNRHYLYIGDIGDNRGKRPEVIVYRLPEPRVDAARPFGTMTAGPAETLRLVYPDRPRDAETLLVDPLTRDIYLIAKRELFPRVYRAAWPQATAEPTRMKQVAVLPWSFPTAGDVSPDGRRVIVRSLYNASLWDRPTGEPLWRAFSGTQTPLPLADEPQGEAICFDHAGTGYFTISEGRHPTLYYFAPGPPPP